MNWTSRLARPLARFFSPAEIMPAARAAALLVGLSGYGFSMAVMVRAGLGLDPWDVFHQGLARHTGMTIGTASAVVGVAVLLAWIPLRNRPGIGTVANVIVIAVTVDAGLWLLPTPTSLPVRIAMMVGAVVLNAFSTVLYIGAALGPGPRDGLMTGLVVRTGLSVRLVRTSIEASALAVGWLLGGTVGVGTVLYALGIGPLVQLFLRITPKRVLAVSGWATVAEARRRRVESSVAEASDLSVKRPARGVTEHAEIANSSTKVCASLGNATRRDRNSACGHGRSAGPRCDRAGR